MFELAYLKTTNASCYFEILHSTAAYGCRRMLMRILPHACSNNIYTNVYCYCEMLNLYKISEVYKLYPHQFTHSCKRFCLSQGAMNAQTFQLLIIQFIYQV